MRHLRFLLLVLALEGALLGLVYLLWRDSMHTQLEQHTHEIHSAYEALVHAYGRTSQLMYDTVINRPGVLHLFEDGVNATGDEQAVLRGRLLRALWPEYRRMLGYDLVQLHFHTADGRSYLRFHKPEVSGDDLLEARPSIRRTLMTREPTEGFESGKLFHGYRYVFPILDGERLLGSVEASISFDAISRGLGDVLPGNEFAFWIRKSSLTGRMGGLDEEMLFSVPLTPDYVIEDIQARIEHRAPRARSERIERMESTLLTSRATIAERLRTGERFAVPSFGLQDAFQAMHFLPVRDLNGQLSGYLVAYAPAQALAHTTTNFAVLGALGGLMLLGLMLFARAQYRNRQALDNERRTLRAITDNMADGLFVQDAQGRIDFWNPALTRLLGFNASRLQGAIAHDLIHAHGEHEAPLPIDACPIRTRTLRGEIYSSEEEYFHTQDHGAIPVQVTSAPIVRDGRIVGSVTVFRDISARREMEAAREEARLTAERSMRAKSEFLANMSHEIRTPLNGVLGMLGLVLETPLTPEQREYIEIAHRSGEMLLGLLNDILDVSKVEAGRIELEHIEFDLTALIEHAGKLLSAQAHTKGLELSVFVDPDLPRRVYGDPLRLRQIIINLLGNAIKFTEEGEVVVRALPSGEGCDSVRMAVVDTGIGIAPEAQEHIFEAFTQADGSTTRRYGGTGLGLTLSRKLVELMGGRLAVNSQPGQGSTFWFDVTLPPAPQLPSETQESTWLDGVSVLIVDDILTNRLILERFTANWGMSPHSFDTPRQALAWASGQIPGGSPPDMALLDMMMPDMDGLQLAATLKSMRPDMRIVLVSSVSDQRESAALDAGIIDAFVAKPVTQDHLRGILLRLRNPATTMPSTAQPAAAPLAKTLSGRHVLVVEDQEVNRLLACRILARHGVETVEATQGVEALQRLEEQHFDLILMDCQMPVMDGPTATHRLREREASQGKTPVPILALTAHAGTDEVDRCIEAGMNAVLSKPYTSQALLEHLLALLPDSDARPDTERAQGHVDSNLNGEPTLPAPTHDETAQAEPINRPLLDELREAIGDELLEIVRYFLSQLDEQLNGLRAAHRDDDRDTLRARAHALKGSAGNLGALPLSHLARDIERLCARPEPISDELIEALTPLATRTRAALQAYLDGTAA